MEEEVNKLRQAGFSDEDIRLYMDSKQSNSTGAASAVDPSQMSATGEIKADETVPDYGATPAPSMGETAMTVGAAVAPYALPATLGVGGLGAGYGIYKGASKALDIGRDIAGGMRERNAIDLKRENRLGVKQQSVLGAGKTSPVPTYNVPTANMPTVNTPMTTTAPTTTTNTQAPQITKAQSIVQQLAMSKLMQGMGAASKIAGPFAGPMLGAAATSPDEIAVLKAAEARKRAQGWKPLNER